MANESVKRGGEGFVEFDESGQVGSVENRVTLIRALVEDVNSAGETRMAHEITVDGKIWRVSVEAV